MLDMATRPTLTDEDRENIRQAVIELEDAQESLDAMIEFLEQVKPLAEDLSTALRISELAHQFSRALFDRLNKRLPKRTLTP